MIPYEDLERALARWKARGQGTAPESATPGDAATRQRGPEAAGNGVHRPSDLSGEIDINELVETYDD